MTPAGLMTLAEQQRRHRTGNRRLPSDRARGCRGRTGPADAEQAAKDEAQRLFDEDTSTEIARIAGERWLRWSPPASPMASAPSAGASPGQVVAVPRRDLPEFEAAKARFAAAEAEREAVKTAERARAALANAQAAAKRPASLFSGPKAPPSDSRCNLALASADAAPDPQQHSRPPKSKT